VDPQWGFVDAFCLDQLEDFLPPGPPALDSPAYADDLNLTKSLGGKTSTRRTADQSDIATFWSDFSYTETPPGHWTSLASNIAQDRNLPLSDTARLFALVSLAQADACVAVWRAKYQFNFWRPVTAIIRADEDDNPATDKDATWQSFLLTPPFPEYISGHSTFSMASAVVLGNFLGGDAVTFSVTSDAVPGALRTYHSLIECANEIGMSRIYGGIHFMSANRDGKACGARIGQFVFDNFLLPNDALPLVRVESSSRDFRLHLRANVHLGKLCVVETSSDLKIWQGITTNAPALGRSFLQLTNRFERQASFFRIREQ
jgi:hypothetical protein